MLSAVLNSDSAGGEFIQLHFVKGEVRGCFVVTD